MNLNDDTDQEIGDVAKEDTVESTILSNIQADNLDHQQEVPRLGLVHWDKSLPTTRVPLLKKWSRADTVLECPPFPNTRNLPTAMSPPLFKCQMSCLLNKLSMFEHAPSARALVVPNKSSRALNIPQPKASSDQNIPQHQEATFEIAKRLMEAIVFTKNPLPILSDNMYMMVEEAWTILVIEAQDHLWALPGALEGTPSVYQLPSSLSLKIDLEA
jgi:hypothetical protein